MLFARELVQLLLAESAAKRQQINVQSLLDNLVHSGNVWEERCEVSLAHTLVDSLSDPRHSLKDGIDLQSGKDGIYGVIVGALTPKVGAGDLQEADQPMRQAFPIRLEP